MNGSNSKNINNKMFSFVYILIAIMIMCFASSAFALSQTRISGTGSDNSSVGTVAWTNPNNINTSGTPYATALAVPAQGGKTHYLKGSNYGFNVPSGVRIDGISAAIKRNSTGTTSPFLRDNEVKMVKAGLIQNATNKAITGTDWSNAAMTVVTYGNSTDKWGVNWTYTDINNANFGIVLSAINSNTNAGRTRDAAVDYMNITVYYTDIQAPVISGTPSDITKEATSASGATATYTAPTATDNVDASVSVSCSPISGSTFAITTTTVTCTAKDAANNTATSSFTIKVQDTTAPSIDSHADVTGNEATSPAGATVSYTSPATTDIVDGAGTATCLPASGSIFALGTTTVTCNAKDVANNDATSTTFTVEVVDTTKPVITLVGSNPQTIEVYSAYSESGAIVSDNYDTGLTATIDASAVDTAKVGSYTVTYNAIDANSNVAVQVTRTVNVVDTTKPTIAVDGSNPQTILVNNAYTELGATVTDNYDTIITAIIDASAVDTAKVGSYTVTYNAIDANGNAAVQQTRTVDVVDTEKPIITLTGANPQSIEVGSAYSEEGYYITDNYDTGLTAIINYSAVDTSKVGSYSVTYDAVDSSGNVADQAIRPVNVIDTTAPSITAPADVTGVEATGTLTSVTLGTPIVSDIGDASPIVTNDAPTGFPVGTTVVTWTATDASGNSATAMQSVTIVDTTAPSITAPADVTGVEATGTLTSVTLGSPIVSDIADASPIVTNDAPASGFPLGTTIVTWDATDASGNSATATQSITVVDTTAPVITLTGNPQSITVGLAYTELGATATDNYDGNLTANITIDATAVNTNTIGTYTVTYDVTDANTNHVQVNRTVNVVSGSSPSVTTRRRTSGGATSIPPVVNTTVTTPAANTTTQPATNISAAVEETPAAPENTESNNAGTGSTSENTESTNANNNQETSIAGNTNPTTQTTSGAAPGNAITGRSILAPLKTGWGIALIVVVCLIVASIIVYVKMTRRPRVHQLHKK